MAVLPDTRIFVPQYEVSRNVRYVWDVVEAHGGRFTKDVMGLLKGGMRQYPSLVSFVGRSLEDHGFDRHGSFGQLSIVTALLAQQDGDQTQKLNFLRCGSALFAAEGLPTDFYQKFLTASTISLLPSRESLEAFGKEIQRYTGTFPLMDTLGIVGAERKTIGELVFATERENAPAILSADYKANQNDVVIAAKAVMADAVSLSPFWTDNGFQPDVLQQTPITKGATDLLAALQQAQDADQSLYLDVLDFG